MTTSVGKSAAARCVRQLAAIRRGRGLIRRKPGEKPFAEQWAEHKREELALEERKFQLLGPPGPKRSKPGV